MALWCKRDIFLYLFGSLNFFYFIIRACFLTDNCWFEIHKQGPWNVFARPTLSEETAECLIILVDYICVRFLSVGLDAVLQAVEFPACIAKLCAGLSYVNWYHFRLLKTNERSVLINFFDLTRLQSDSFQVGSITLKQRNAITHTGLTPIQVSSAIKFWIDIEE